MNNIFEDLQRRETPERSVRWYQDNIRKLGINRKTSALDIMESTIGKLNQNTVIGSMYLFLYDPKTKEKLPYYDRFPLVFPFNILDDGFMGINLHYLPPMVRMVLLNRLLTLNSDKTLTPTSRLQLSWGLLKNVDKFPGAKPCVKRYLSGHIQTKMMLISPLDWKKTIMLPIDRFEKATNFKVWRDSRQRMHG